MRHHGDTRTECQMEDLVQIWSKIVHCWDGATHTHGALSPQREGSQSKKDNTSLGVEDTQVSRKTHNL